MQLFLLLKLCIITRWGYNTPPDSPRNIEQLRHLVPELDIYAIPSQEGMFDHFISTSALCLNDLFIHCRKP